ncbi:uncharacterized protein [Triticum aestivum]|uniref:uncharacterized protein isoform X3 n=1 Tax=Triticum aestivum TaxID=4565 RepID=UPI001D0250CC|nr:uncharacterized protein LOC123149753 isoform X3 [Triticum aestivum]
MPHRRDGPARRRVGVPLRMWSGSPRGRTKARRCQHAPSPSRPYTPTSAVQICRGRCSSDKRFGGKKLIQPWSSPRRRTSSITPAAVQMFSEHDEELNENEDAFMSVEADAEAGDKSVLHSIIDDEVVEGANLEAAQDDKPIEVES